MLLFVVMEQTLNFVLNCGKTAKEHTQMLKTAYGNEALPCMHVLEWIKSFRKQQENLEYNTGTGQPSSALNKLAKVHELGGQTAMKNHKNRQRINCTLT